MKEFYDEFKGMEDEFLKECLPCLDCGEVNQNLRYFFSKQLARARFIGQEETKADIVEKIKEFARKNPEYSPGIIRALDYCCLRVRPSRLWERIFKLCKGVKNDN